jgi:alkaline phosphatase D
MPTVYSENSLDDDDDDDGKGKHLKDRFRARCNWWIVLCVVLVLVGSILIGAMVPFSGGPRQNQAQNSNTSNSTNNTNNTNSGAGNGGSGSSGINSSTSPANTSSLTTSPTKAPLVQPSLRPTLPLEEIVANEIDNEIDNDNDSATQQPQIRLDMGPMVGHTTHDSVTLWAYYVKPAMYLLEENYAIEILLYDSDGRVTTTFVEADPNRQRYNPVFATLTNLEALEVYRYEMRILGQGVGSGSFKTASAPPLETTAARTAAATTTRTEKEGGRKLQTTGTTFEYVLASCMDRSEQPTQKVWDAIPTTNADGTKDYPDFAILAGDTIYLQEGIDIVNFWGVRFDRYWYRNREQRTEPHFAKFVANTPIYAVWNNHDYGAETANMGQAGKEESLRAWKSLWPNPAYPGSSNSNMNNNNSNNNSNSNNGIYYSFYRGDVHYIVTDDHWNRDPFRENRWGAKQTDWITSELLSSRGTFKVIVLGSDILERGWSSDLDTIGAVVTKHSINGVLFNAGDIHRNEYKRKTGHGFPYPVTQITSSGIAKVWRKPFAKITVDTTLDDPMITVRFFGAANMEADTTWINDSEMVCSAIEGVEDREKEHSCTETIRLSDLSVAS